MTVSTELNSLAGDDQDGAARTSAFQVHLDVFEGPFDLLLALISKHKLDITEVALSQVTDEFIGYISERSDGWDLDQVSYFLVVAATLLDLKAARLLPSGEVEDEEDLALLEARDLLFARLLQYRAYKEVAAIFAARMTAAARRFPRRVPLEPRFAGLLPEVLLGLGPAEFARLASLALTPKPPPKVDTQHIHSPVISIRDQARVHRYPAAGTRPGQLPAADRRRRRQLRGGGLVPRPARAVPRGHGVLRAGRPAGRALRDLDGHGVRRHRTRRDRTRQHWTRQHGARRHRRH